MKFYSIDACDQFPDETIFWVTLTNLPDEIRNRAMLIDGENFSEGNTAQSEQKRQGYGKIEIWINK